jgi:hypothetical protein
MGYVPNLRLVVPEARVEMSEPRWEVTIERDGIWPTPWRETADAPDLCPGRRLQVFAGERTLRGGLGRAVEGQMRHVRRAVGKRYHGSKQKRKD